MDETEAARDRLALRLRTALELTESGFDLKRQQLRRRHAEANDAEIERLFRLWLMERPGAEHGDGDGRPTSLSRVSAAP